MKAGELRIYLEIRDPLSLSLTLVHKILNAGSEESDFVSIEQDRETQTCRFIFTSTTWPTDGVGETEAAVLFRHLWKDSAFINATQWLHVRTASEFAALAEQDMEVHLVVRGYEGTIPAPFLNEIARLGLRFAVLME